MMVSLGERIDENEDALIKVVLAKAAGTVTSTGGIVLKWGNFVRGTTNCNGRRRTKVIPRRHPLY